MPSLQAIRERFPALGCGMALLENAGGSQVPREVAESIGAYMLDSYVQLGAGYPTLAGLQEASDWSLFAATVTQYEIVPASSAAVIAIAVPGWRL